MKQILFILLLFYNSYCFGQYYNVEYKEITAAVHPTNTILTISDSVSWYEIIPNDKQKKNIVLSIKNYKNNFVYFAGVIYNGNVRVKDTLHDFKWKLTKDKKTILGYACLGAKTSFRGRNYTAYYAPSIAVAEGPWKFGGLPGLILEISADDGYIVFNSVKVSKLQTALKVPRDIYKHKYISWPEYVIVYKKDIDNHIQMLKTSEAENPIGENNKQDRSFFIINVEKIYKEVEEGIGIRY